MNAELTRVLVEAGLPKNVRSRDLIVVQNRGQDRPGTLRSNFNFVVLRRATPQFFVKCRAAGHPVLEWETAVRSLFAPAVSSSIRVPAATGASSDRFSVQVAPFVQGLRYSHVSARQATASYLKMLVAILNGMRELVALSRRLYPNLDLARHEWPLDLLTSSKDSLEYVAEHTPLSRSQLDSLLTALAAGGTVPSIPQHGDLWHQNVIIDGSRTWVIDFEQYGAVCCPLYDALTLLTSTLRLRRLGEGRGMQALLGSTPEAVACRQILMAQAEADAVAPQTLDAILAYYVMHRASMVSRRAGVAHGRPHLDDVRWLAEQLVSKDGRLLAPE